MSHQQFNKMRVFPRLRMDRHQPIVLSNQERKCRPRFLPISPLQPQGRLPNKIERNPLLSFPFQCINSQIHHDLSASLTRCCRSRIGPRHPHHPHQDLDRDVGPSGLDLLLVGSMAHPHRLYSVLGQPPASIGAIQVLCRSLSGLVPPTDRSLPLSLLFDPVKIFLPLPDLHDQIEEFPCGQMEADVSQMKTIASARPIRSKTGFGRDHSAARRFLIHRNPPPSTGYSLGEIFPSATACGIGPPIASFMAWICCSIPFSSHRVRTGWGAKPAPFIS